jgi:hypothetical protein
MAYGIGISIGKQMVFVQWGVVSHLSPPGGAGRAHGWGRSCPGDGKRLCCILGAPRLCTLSLWPSLSPSLPLCLCARARRRHRRPFAFLFGFLLCSVSWLVQPGDFRRRLCWWWLTSDNKPLPPPFFPLWRGTNAVYLRMD